ESRPVNYRNDGRSESESAHERAADPEWEKAQASMHRIWTRAPGGATVIARVLDAIADLQDSAQNGASSRAPKSQSDS
uniref:hypothetical protein n=1 Tax=Methylobacterium sp. CCH7-A2 TaxID=1768789 RepID=UPI001AECBCF4